MQLERERESQHARGEGPAPVSRRPDPPLSPLSPSPVGFPLGKLECRRLPMPPPLRAQGNIQKPGSSVAPGTIACFTELKMFRRYQNGERVSVQPTHTTGFTVPGVPNPAPDLQTPFDITPPQPPTVRSCRGGESRGRSVNLGIACSAGKRLTGLGGIYDVWL